MNIAISTRHLSGSHTLKRFAERTVRSCLEHAALGGGTVEATLTESHSRFTVKYAMTTLSGRRLMCEASDAILATAVQEATARLVSSLARLKSSQYISNDDNFEWEDDDFEPEFDQARPYP